MKFDPASINFFDDAHFFYDSVDPRFQLNRASLLWSFSENKIVVPRDIQEDQSFLAPFLDTFENLSSMRNVARVSRSFHGSKDHFLQWKI